MSDNIFVKLAKMLVKSKFKKILDEIGDELENDPLFKARAEDIKNRTDSLVKDLDHFCHVQPWHHLCKDKKEQKK